MCIRDRSPGTYEVSFSISAPDAGGIFFAQLSGQNLGVIDVPATGGWYNWEDLPAQTISVSEGEKFLKIQIVQAGFNIQSVNFNQVLSIDNSFLNPDDFVLGKPYPNPFNPATTIAYQIAKSEFVNISIFDLAGNRVKKILNQHVNSGLGFATWDGKNEIGQNVSGGIYLYSIDTPSFSQTRKMILLK